MRHVCCLKFIQREGQERERAQKKKNNNNALLMVIILLGFS